jgi:hypothetical protein
LKGEGNVKKPRINRYQRVADTVVYFEFSFWVNVERFLRLVECVWSLLCRSRARERLRERESEIEVPDLNMVLLAKSHSCGDRLMHCMGRIAVLIFNVFLLNCRQV